MQMEMKDTHSLVRQPFMSDDDLRVRSQTTLDPARLPIPEHDIPVRVTARDPFPVRRESDLTGVSCDGMTRKALLPVLAEVFGGVDDDLVVQRLSGEPFF